MKRIHLSMIAGALLGAMLFNGCASNTGKGGAIGAGAGAVIGGVIGKQYGKTAQGAIIGAAIGGSGGALIGRYMDKQAEEMQQDIEGAKIERVGEGIKITFDSGILFAVNSSDLTSTARTNITNLAGILQKYEDTNIFIEGHTDATGSDEYNQGLSERRAESVAAFTASQGVSRARMSTIGHGETMPVASNDTESGRALNRRVEVAIFANERLKKAAQEGREL